MKRVIILSFVSLILMVSCQKKEVEETIYENDQEQNKVYLDDRWYDRWWLDPDEFGCEPNPGRCMYTVVVTGLCDPDIIDNVILTVETGSASQIVSIFMSYENDLDNVMPAYLIAGVINGELTVENDGVFSQNSIAYLQFYTLTGPLERVVRLTK